MIPTAKSSCHKGDTSVGVKYATAVPMATVNIYIVRKDRGDKINLINYLPLTWLCMESCFHLPQDVATILNVKLIIGDTNIYFCQLYVMKCQQGYFSFHFLSIFHCDLEFREKLRFKMKSYLPVRKATMFDILCFIFL